MRAIMQYLRSFIRLEYPYEDPIERYRAQLLISLVDVLFVLALVISGLLLLDTQRTRPNANLTWFAVILLMVLSPIVIVIVQRGGNRFVARAFVLALTMIIVVVDVLSGAAYQQVTTFAPILLASLMLTWSETLIVMLIIIALNFYQLTLRPGFSLETVNPILLFAMPFFYIFMTAILITTTQWFFRLARRFQAEFSRLREITFPLLRINLNTDEMAFINQAIESIAANLGFPTVRVYLTEGDKRDALRFIQSGTTTQQHIRQAVEPGSAFAAVLQMQTPLFIDQNSSAAERAHFLPGTTSSALVPLMYREQVLGILDMQSVSDRLIDTGERELISLIALHLATTIGNTRTLNTIQNEVKQQQEVIMRQRNRLRQIEQTEQQAIVSAWGDYLDQRDQRIIGFDINEVSMQLIPTDYLPDHMRLALERNDVTTYEENDQQHVTLPIQLRGQTLGAASFSVPRTRPITRRQIEIMRNVIQRLALALDNKRLFEQSQSQAQRESKANEIASLLLSSTDMDTVLRLAAVNFNDALGAVQTEIQLFAEAVEPIREERA